MSTDARLQALEQQWFQTQIALLNDEGLIPYAELLPMREPFRAGIVWAPWGKTMWRFYRAWTVARITGTIPATVWSRFLPEAHGCFCALCKGAASAPRLQVCLCALGPPNHAIHDYSKDYRGTIGGLLED